MLTSYKSLERLAVATDLVLPGIYCIKDPRSQFSFPELGRNKTAGQAGSMECGVVLQRAQKLLALLPRGQTVTLVSLRT